MPFRSSSYRRRSRFRTPTWRRIYFPEAYGQQLGRLRHKVELWYQAAKNFDKEWSISLKTLNSAVDIHLYNLAMVLSCSNNDALAGARIIVLHAKEVFPFVTCDNPVRPYYPDRIRRMFTEPLPGFLDPRVQIVYPIDPKTCLLISSNPSYPAFDHTDIEARQVRKINTALAIMADKEIIFAGPDVSVFENWLKPDLLRPIKSP